MHPRRLKACIKVDHAYSREEIPADKHDMATPEIAKQWNHLRGIAQHIHHRPDVKIGMLIGRNVPTAFQPLSIIYGDEEEPWAEEYKFGWTVIGRVCLGQKTLTNKVTVNRVSVISKEKKILEADNVMRLIDNTPSNHDVTKGVTRDDAVRL